ncbi:MAG: hypothetical protein DRR19_05705 [Candidatus Parabeggiatoa sp. nov. 1]|nr:MAG: hypothetical protein DRR19_05705 [Gammaproteobacteria bacterium]
MSHYQEHKANLVRKNGVIYQEYKANLVRKNGVIYQEYKANLVRTKKRCDLSGVQGEPGTKKLGSD